ncbi:hypothetical protein C8R45DRAFT_1101681 [Mycena sanguinolenta]|nr:hypothetical protein C8R45DRAFT_1101681 [Mycena sanguinolenta]
MARHATSAISVVSVVYEMHALVPVSTRHRSNVSQRPSFGLSDWAVYVAAPFHLELTLDDLLTATPPTPGQQSRSDLDVRGTKLAGLLSAHAKTNTASRPTPACASVYSAVLRIPPPRHHSVTRNGSLAASASSAANLTEAQEEEEVWCVTMQVCGDATCSESVPEQRAPRYEVYPVRIQLEQAAPSRPSRGVLRAALPAASSSPVLAADVAERRLVLGDADKILLGLLQDQDLGSQYRLNDLSTFSGPSPGYLSTNSRAALVHPSHQHALVVFVIVLHFGVQARPTDTYWRLTNNFLKFVSNLANVGDGTLMIHPTSTTHQQFSKAGASGMRPDLIRIAIRECAMGIDGSRSRDGPPIEPAIGIYFPNPLPTESVAPTLYSLHPLAPTLKQR